MCIEININLFTYEEICYTQLAHMIIEADKSQNLQNEFTEQNAKIVHTFKQNITGRKSFMVSGDPES